MKKCYSGFTLIELLVTVALVALLATFAVPSFRWTIQNNQLVSCANKLVSAVQYAKSEAVTSRQTIFVSDDNGGNFTTMRVGTDPDGDNFVDDINLMQIIECEGQGLTITELNSNVSFLSFGPTGFRADGQGVLQFLTCNEAGNGRILNITNGGGVTSSEAPNGSC